MATRAKAQAEAVRLANGVRAFPILVPITRMDGSLGPIDPTPTQDIILGVFGESRWTMVDKYRQAKSSIIHDADILRHVAYSPGHMGLLVGDKEATYKEQIRRIAIMYDGLPDFVKPELSRPASSEGLAFKHKGELQGITGGGENPAIGFSPDYAMITEYFLFERFDAFNRAFFPAVDRRPHGVCRIESTPGRYDSEGHKMWLSAVAGRGKFRAVFLAWWHDDSCWLLPPPDFQPNKEEVEYRKKIAAFERDAVGKAWYPYRRPMAVSDGHLFFRRVSLETQFHGDTRLFDSQFPPSPFEGWLTSLAPAIPQDALAEYLTRAVDTTFGEEVFFERREHGCPYVILADGAGFGKSGDPSAMTLVNMWDWSEAGSWEGREDPDVFASRIMRWQRDWDADVIVEANKDGVVSSLVTRNCPKIHWSGGHPGWYASEVSKANAFADLVAMLRKREPTIRSRDTLMQMQSWDGKGARGARVNGKAHHFDRATTWLLFAYAARVLGHPRRATAPEARRELGEGGWTISDFDALFAGDAEADRRVGNVLGSVR